METLFKKKWSQIQMEILSKWNMIQTEIPQNTILMETLFQQNMIHMETPQNTIQTEILLKQNMIQKAIQLMILNNSMKMMSCNKMDYSKQHSTVESTINQQSNNNHQFIPSPPSMIKR